ncbi:DUF3285 domain-containing protein [Oscillatoriales cyanobacterium LEGE 11467]|uniref:DUF3285 domain-containing protein n=1 Tax=Zarconia navalis LEGE 11467 TaxID=1828826 RepID=A0A928VXE1_9CYAN|nr:DUF3285 domain-containing protein [Zarconia navalis]MBE9041967.1 DUF3285 domain-containing protein [Zarconia navalis LEGE 11467]
MNDSPTPTPTPTTPATNEPKPSYVKLAMRNMVRKGQKSATHFTITAVGLLAFFIGVSYLTR